MLHLALVTKYERTVNKVVLPCCAKCEICFRTMESAHCPAQSRLTELSLVLKYFSCTRNVCIMNIMYTEVVTEMQGDDVYNIYYY